MKILYAGPGTRFKHRYFYYSFFRMLLSGFTKLDANVFHFADRDTADSYFLGMRALGKPHVQRQFLQDIEMLNPDLIVLVHADLIDVETVRRAKIPGRKVVLVDCDILEVTADNHTFRRIQKHAPNLDAVFCTTGGARLRAMAQASGVPAYFLPNPLDAGSIQPDPAREPAYDLGYVSTHKHRLELLNDLEAAEPRLKILTTLGGKERLYGVHFEAFLNRARCGLVWSVYNQDFYSSDRIAQVFGLGLCACVPSALGLQKFLGADDAIFFDGATDLAAKIMAARDQDWRRIGHNGRRAYVENFGAGRVAQYILDRTFAPTQDRTGWADL